MGVAIDLIEAAHVESGSDHRLEDVTQGERAALEDRPRHVIPCVREREPVEDTARGAVPLGRHRALHGRNEDQTLGAGRNAFRVLRQEVIGVTFPGRLRFALAGTAASVALVALNSSLIAPMIRWVNGHPMRQLFSYQTLSTEFVFAALGVGAIVFDVIFDFPGSEPSLPLFAFIFLVALGIAIWWAYRRLKEPAQRHAAAVWIDRQTRRPLLRPRRLLPARWKR